MVKIKKEWMIAALVLLLAGGLIYYPREEEKKNKITIHDDFLTLLGSQTQYWKYLSQDGDFENLELFHHLYEKNKQFQFQGGFDYKIPKVIHFIWLGPRSFPRESIENVRSWSAHHPDWTIKFWTDRERIPPVPSMEVHDISNFVFKKLRTEYEEAMSYSEKSDILRYEILFQEGGIYVDHNAKCLRPFHRLNQGYDFFACLELPHPAYDDHIITAGIGILGARPGHPILGGALSLVHQRWKKITEKFQLNDPQSDQDRIVYRSYIALTYALKKNLDLSGNTDIVFPASYFYAKGALPAFYSEWASSPRRRDGGSETEWLEARLDTLVSHQQGLLFATWLLFSTLLCTLGIALKRKYLSCVFVLLFLTSCAKAPERPFVSKECGLENSEDVKQIEYYQSLFEVNKELLPKTRPAIPKILHFIWLGPQFFTQVQERHLRLWMKKHPDWEIKIWSDRPHVLPFPSVKLCLIDHKAFTFLSPYYKETTSYRERADLARFEILYKEGGVVVDWTLEPMQKLDPLNASYDFYAAIHPPYDPILDTQITVSSDLMGAIPKHSIVALVMKNMAKSWEAVQKAFPQNNKESLIYRTAYRVFAPLNEALRSSLSDPSYRNIVFPSYYFTDLYAKSDSSWLSGASRFERDTKDKLDRLIQKGRYLIFVDTLLIILTLLILFKICFPKRCLETSPYED